MAKVEFDDLIDESKSQTRSVRCKYSAIQNSISGKLFRIFILCYFSRYFVELKFVCSLACDLYVMNLNRGK